MPCPKEIFNEEKSNTLPYSDILDFLWHHILDII